MVLVLVGTVVAVGRQAVVAVVVVVLVGRKVLGQPPPHRVRRRVPAVVGTYHRPVVRAVVAVEEVRQGC